jgi:hypothetical protein
MKRFIAGLCWSLLIFTSVSIAQNEFPEELPDDYLPFTMRQNGDTLNGESRFLEGFQITMVLPGTASDRTLNVDSLFSLVRRGNVKSTLTYPSGRTTPITYEIVHHRKQEDIYMKSSLGYFLWEYLNIEDSILRFAIYWWYCPPATERDLKIIEMARKLLDDPDRWHQEDDRKCEHDNETNRWSLFCALKHASLEIEEEYNHHNTAIQTARFVIDDLIPGHDYAHTLMDFNNEPETKHADVLHVLKLTTERINKELRNNSTREHHNQRP